MDTAHVAEGSRVLITAPAGGAGHLAVQIAKASGASVIGMTVPDAEGHVRSLGADEVIDYTTTEFAGRLFVEADRLGLTALATLVTAGKLRRTIAATCPLEHAGEAQSYRAISGKVVLTL
ncbi:zinc-binding dehydrogenase [Mycolicibacterium fortuitum]|uniref:zinc-binding dehydrogenase n=1 Tax=Mycolicibacterium fortuitum TaxID=1766 RepID=UPI003013AC8F